MSLRAHTDSFDESVILRVRGQCACGYTLRLDKIMYEPAGTVSLTKLMELSILGCDLARCLCGAWEGRVGSSWACYRLPGCGSYLVAGSRIEAYPRVASLTVRDQLPKERRQGVIVSLDSSELEASVRLGQPASVRAAWLEALFALHLGARTREFACGLGMRAVATVDEGASGYLDLSVLRLADGSGPVQWLGAEALQTLERGDLACLVEVDLGIVRESIEKEISRRQLVVTGSGRLCLQLRGGMFSLYIDSESLLSTAVGRGLLLQLELEHELERVQQRLAALDNGGQDLIGRLQPQSVRLQPESTNMLLRMPGGEIKVDVGDYVDASVGARESMFAQWVEFS